MTSLLDRLRCRFRWWRIRRRRRRLLRTYAALGRIRYGVGPVFTPTMYALSCVEEEGLATVSDDGDLRWHWPDTGARAAVAEVAER